MEPVTHALSGTLCGLAARPLIPHVRWLVPLCLLASQAPDVDNFFANGDPEAYLLYHRGVTHSVFAPPAFAAVFALLAALVNRTLAVPWGRLFALFALVAGMEIWLDYVTSYGTMLLAPFSDARFTLDSVFIIDPFLTLPLVALLVAALAWRRRRAALALAGVLWVFLYPLGNKVVGTLLDTRLNAAAPAGVTVHVVPDAFTPLWWKTVADDGERWTLSTVNILDVDTEQPRRTYERADPAVFARLGRQASMFRTYAWFTRFPYVERRPGDDGRVLRFGDLGFASVQPVMRRVSDARGEPFRLTAHLGPDGELERWTYSMGSELYEHVLTD